MMQTTKTLIKKLKALCSYTILLSIIHWLVIVIFLGCIFLWIYLGLFFLLDEI